jgi:hypothetical protein
VPSAAHQYSKFPRGSTLRCRGCGKTGSVGSITGHTARSASCKGSPIDLVTPPSGGVEALAVPVLSMRPRLSPAGPHPPEPPSGYEDGEGVGDDGAPDSEPEATPALPSADPLAADEDGVDDDDFEEEGEDEEDEDTPEVAAATGKRAPARPLPPTGTGPRGGTRRATLRKPPPGAAGVTTPHPVLVNLNIDLWASTLGRFEAARDSSLGYEGTVDDFVNEVVQEHFDHCLGLQLQLNRRVPARVA